MAETTRKLKMYVGTYEDEIEHLAKNLRQEDHEELAAWGMKPQHLLDMKAVFASKGLQWAVHRDDEPVFALGLLPNVHRTYSVWGFGTPEANSIMGELGRHMRREWFDEVFGLHRARRIEAKVPLASDKSWQWLSWLGAKIETKMSRFGANGEDFLLLSFTDRDYEAGKHVFLQRPRTPSPASRSEREDVG